MKGIVTIAALIAITILSSCSITGRYTSGAERTPEKELQANLLDQKLVFYCYGSFLDGYAVPGLSKEEVSEFIDSGAYDIENRYQTDPAPFNERKGYFDWIIDFMAAYNRLLVDYLKNEPIKKSVVSTATSAE